MTETKENERVSVTVERLGGCEVELSVLIKPEECQKFYQEALKVVRQKVSLPGFRKGKAPVATVKKQFADAIDDQWHEGLMNAAAKEALTLTDLYPWSSQGIPRPKLESASMEEGAKLVFRFESEPEISAVKKEDVKVERIFAKEATDEMVDKEIAALRAQHATYEPQDAAAEEGGWVRIDVESTAGEKPEKVIENHLVELVKGKCADWLRNMVIGKKADDVIEGTTSPDEDAPEDVKKAFESRPCQVTVRAVEKQIPPEDESLISTVKAESMEALRKSLKERLEHEEKEQADQQTKEKLWDFLFTNYPAELPKSLAEAEEKATIKTMIDDLRRQGIDDEQIVSRESEVEASAKERVARRLHAIFLSRKMVAEIGEQPTDKEIEDRAMHLLMWEAISKGHPPPTSPDPQVLQNHRHNAFLLIVRERVENYLLG